MTGTTRRHSGAARSVCWSLVFWFGLFGCAGPREAEDGREPPARAERKPVEDTSFDLELEATTDAVHTIQLYAGTEEALPILSIRGREKLTLEFDLMAEAGRPLSVYFYHADREWKRDLQPGEYLSSFHHDELYDYRISRGTQVPYTHYTYTFPNTSIEFRVSGNYILRVTEQGREDDVLFERPFFVAEDVAAPQLTVEPLLLPGPGSTSAQPFLMFTPPSGLGGNVFDYAVCFMRNGLWESTRCSDNPSLTRQPDLLFYLDPEQAFRAHGAEYVLDLSSFRVGRGIERVDLSERPYEVVLEPDYARFPASGIDPLLNGQAVVGAAVRDVAEPDTEGEYVEVGFSFIPEPEGRLPGGLFVVGSFNGWTLDLAEEMRWIPDRGRYEVTLLVKQGQYEYRYTSPEPAARRALQNPLPRPENTYAAFVYLADVSLQSDRLLATQTIRAR